MVVRPWLRTVTTLGVAAVLGATPTGAAVAAPAVSSFADGSYVVTLVDDPVAAYDGTLPGLPQLKSAPGGGVDLAQAAAEKYRAFLLDTQTSIAGLVGATPLQRYTVALNGFSARLTAAQAQKLSATPGVLAVSKDTVRHVDATAASPLAAAAPAAVPAGPTTTTADYLGLTGANGVWNQLGGAAAAGKGVVVADLDTGLWPEHPSVAGAQLTTAAPAGDRYGAYRSGGAVTMAKADGGTYRGVCETGQDWTAQDCTTKVVGARAFSAGFTAGSGPLAATEPASARDTDGHGTHTATTAAGRSGVPASVDGVPYGDVTGIAPAAAIAVYKVCWTAASGDAGCATSDLVSAIDAAVADNVDVINFSIGGGAATDVVDPVELAFLSAASAGVFVSASAGNSGPAASTLDHASPWITTVGAATSVLREGTVVLGDGTKFVGARLVQAPLAKAPMVLAARVALQGAKKADAEICLAGSLDPAKAKGKVVICKRAVTARVDKSAEVARAGGVGMILYNPTPNSTEPDAHAVPTVHLDATAGAKVVTYATRNPGATVSFQAGNTTGRATPAPQLAAFSSRGPTFVNDGDVLKPDVAAPGSGVLAGYSPRAAGARGNLFAPESGTSMSAPHVAGLAALYFTAHPDWTPMAVKSALMTTARSLEDAAGKDVANVFDGGAGFVDPTRMLTPGLVYDSGALDWLGYLEGSSVDTGTGVDAIDPSDLNQASIAVGDLAGTRTITRSVTATTGGLYYGTASVPGFRAEVTPSVLYVAAGETKQFRVTFTRTDADIESWTAGALTWKGAGLTVRSPIALRPVTVAAPAQVTGSGASGSAEITVTSGVEGDLGVRAVGLVEGTTSSGSVREGAQQVLPVTVPEGAVVSRFDLVARDAAADLDLYLYAVGADGTAELIASSATGSADERIDVVADPGRYLLVVQGYAAAPGASSAGYALTTFQLTPAAQEGALTLTPDPVLARLGQQATFSVGWSGLDPRARYLGAVRYGDSPTPTLLAVG